MSNDGLYEGAHKTTLKYYTRRKNTMERKVFTIKITNRKEGRIIDAIVDQVEFLGITNKHGLTEVGYRYKNYIQHFIDLGYEPWVIKEAN